jgi:regulator of RNase E activity RraA
MSNVDQPDTIPAGLSKLDTAALSDAMDSFGLACGLQGIRSQALGAHICGPAYTVRYRPVDDAGGFRNAANYIDDVPRGSVIVSSNSGRADCTVWGDILTQVAIAKGIAGVVIDGAARDIATIRKLNFPVFSRAVFMQSGKNRVQLDATSEPVAIGGVTINPGDYIVCDDNGCVAIPRAMVEAVIERANATEATEQRILAAVRAGRSLAEARQAHRYDQPWLPAKGGK